MRKGANDVLNAIRTSRLRAVKSRTPVCILFSPGAGSEGTLISFEDSGAGGPSTNRNNGIKDAGEAVIVESSMPDAIDMYNTTLVTGPSGDPTLRYDAKGLKLPYGTIQFIEMKTQADSYRRVAVDPSGNAKVERSGDGSSWY